MKESCSECRFYQQRMYWEQENAGRVKVVKGSYGWCHRYAPKPALSPVDNIYWPVVKDDDWCGEFESKTNKQEAGK